MRIGIDCRLWSESGVGRYIRNLVGKLLIIDKDNQYVLFVLSKDLENIKFKVQSSRQRRGSPRAAKFKVNVADIRWHTLEEQLRFPTILNKENLDLVHFPYFSVPIFYNKPFVVTIHDLILHHFPTGEATTLPSYLYRLKLVGYKYVISKGARKARKIITVSNATKKEIVDHLGVSQDKVVVTYEGVFEKSKIKNQKSKVQVKIQNYFLYVGNAYPHKNLNRLLDAFSMVNGQWSMVKLIMVGREDYFYKRLKEKVKNMDLQKSVLFYGEVSDEDLANLYRNARALVIPSLMEGFGLPALEAMSNKCLVLASNIPSLKEICGDAALYFDPQDTDDIGKSMKSVLLNASNHFTKKIEQGFKRSKDFSWKKMAKETLSIYQKR